MSGFPWSLDGRKFLTPAELEKVHVCAVRLRRQGIKANDPLAVRDWFLVETALSSGLRLMELTRLTCGDLLVGQDRPELVVRQGKGGKSRVVKVGRRWQLRAKWYLRFKEQHGEAVKENAPLFAVMGGGRPLARRQMQNVFARLCAKAELSRHYRFHSMRHSFATELYRVSGGNLRLVQKQLGHSRITTTQVYADVMDEDAQAAMEEMYKRNKKPWKPKG